jgi:hypothetical protein
VTIAAWRLSCRADVASACLAMDDENSSRVITISREHGRSPPLSFVAPSQPEFYSTDFVPRAARLVSSCHH